MRILWFTNVPMAPLVQHWGKKATGTGFWMHAQLAPLRRHPEIVRLGVVYAGTGCTSEQIEIEGVDYFVVAQSTFAQRTGIAKKRDEDRCLHAFVKIVEKFQPDLIHIHGTERFYGRLKTEGFTDVPAIVSLQGLMRAIAQYAWGERTFAQMVPLVNVWEVVRLFPTLTRRVRMLRSAKTEEAIIRGADGVLGRTAFDRSYCRMLDQEKSYFHEDRLLRTEFYGPLWRLASAKRHRIYTTGRLSFAKGMHVFLEAMAILKREYPNLECRIAGQITSSPEAVYMRRLIGRLGLTEAVTFLNWIPADQIVVELLSTHCYVNTSLIENSCNSLQEAMMLGVPCVATFTGGMPTLLHHRKNGLMAPPGCVHLVADAVREVFESDALCEELGRTAQELGARRHAPETIINQLLHAYRTTIDLTTKSPLA